MAFDPKKSTDGKLFVDFVGGSNMDLAKDMHIHKGWTHLKGGDQIKAEWTAFAEGKPAHSTKLVLSRKK